MNVRVRKNTQKGSEKIKAQMEANDNSRRIESVPDEWFCVCVRIPLAVTHCNECHKG